MFFDLVLIKRAKDGQGNDVYRSFIQNGRVGRNRTFVHRRELIETLRRILEAQQPRRILTNDVLERIETGFHQWTGGSALDLTVEQAQALGW